MCSVGEHSFKVPVSLLASFSSQTVDTGVANPGGADPIGGRLAASQKIGIDSLFENGAK
jgi:hypothetical protein